MARKTKKTGYDVLRPHAARVIKLGQYPLHVNGGYLDDPKRIPHIDGRPPADK